jgi:hypothetical protein
MKLQHSIYQHNRDRCSSHTRKSACAVQSSPLTVCPRWQDLRSCLAAVAPVGHLVCCKIANYQVEPSVPWAQALLAST